LPGDRKSVDPMAVRMESRGRIGRRWPRHRHRLPRRHHKNRPSLCRRHLVLHQPVAARRGTVASKEMERALALDVLDPSRRQTSASISQANGARPSWMVLPAGHRAQRSSRAACAIHRLTSRYRFPQADDDDRDNRICGAMRLTPTRDIASYLATFGADDCRIGVPVRE